LRLVQKRRLAGEGFLRRLQLLLKFFCQRLRLVVLGARGFERFDGLCILGALRLQRGLRGQRLLQLRPCVLQLRLRVLKLCSGIGFALAGLCLKRLEFGSLLLRCLKLRLKAGTF
jgi:hypothetical protein